MSRLEDLLAQVQRLDPQLARDIDAEVKPLKELRRFGLNFERHQPEAVELPGRPVRRGDKVRILPARDGSTKPDKRIWQVAGFSEDRLSAALVFAHPSEPETCEALVADLVVVAEFRDPIYPGLRSVERIERGGEAPFHAVINAENFHALQALTYTHEASVDAIYIDPPYNTGNQGWIYNDAYVAADDVYKHSKWLAFIERRLLLAKRLLAPTGVIIVAIGDDEHHRLRMLMDQVFGAENFISNVVWQGGRKNDSRYVSNGADYMLVYARDESAMATVGIRWREDRPGVDEVLAAGSECWARNAPDGAAATAALRAWFASLSKDHPAKRDGNYNYNRIDDSGRVFYANDMRSPSPRPNLQYDLMHPVTGEVTMRDRNGWAFSRSTMDDLIADGRIWFDHDNTRLPRLKKYLDEQGLQVSMSVFEKDRRAASRHLARVHGEKRFPNPKDHEVLMRWLRLVAPTTP